MFLRITNLKNLSKKLYLNKEELQQIKASKIEVKEVTWQGPFSWVGYEDQDNLDKITDAIMSIPAHNTEAMLLSYVKVKVRESISKVFNHFNHFKTTT